jgi:hypothetical protein
MPCCPFSFAENRKASIPLRDGGTNSVLLDLVVFELLIGNLQVVGDLEYSKNAIGA